MRCFLVSHSKNLGGTLKYKSGCFDAFSTPSMLYEATTTLSLRYEKSREEKTHWRNPSIGRDFFFFSPLCPRNEEEQQRIGSNLFEQLRVGYGSGCRVIVSFRRWANVRFFALVSSSRDCSEMEECLRLVVAGEFFSGCCRRWRTLMSPEYGP